MTVGPASLKPVSDCSKNYRPVVRENTLHEETRTCQSKENLKSGGARHQEELVD
jgi:hypothetical protein